MAPVCFPNSENLRKVDGIGGRHGCPQIGGSLSPQGLRRIMFCPLIAGRVYGRGFRVSSESLGLLTRVLSVGCDFVQNAHRDDFPFCAYRQISVFLDCTIKSV